MTTKIIIADDNADIREIISVLLSSEGYRVVAVPDGKAALEHMEEDIDLVILDVMMPDMDGYQVCRKIRQISNVPILFLTAKGLDADKTLGFSFGADDYLAKPFSYNELTARVKALLRRYQIYKGKAQDHHPTPSLSCEGLTLDPAQKQVLIDEKRVDLTDTECAILQLLMTNRGQLFSAAMIYEKVWDEPYFYSANNTVMVHIRNLRKKIEQDPDHPRYIHTVWGRGYRFD